MTNESSEPPLPERNPIIHNFALGGTVLIPFVMALPPRRLDMRFFALASTWSLASNQLAYEYTGKSIYSRVGSRFSSFTDMGLPESARKTQQLIREQKERDAALKRANTVQQEADAKSAGLAGTVSDVWMGGESADWKAKRAEEDRRSLEEGKGFSGIIIEQISDVFSGNWGSSAKKADGDQDPKRR